MIIEPKIRGFICTTAHPAGCGEHVKRQIEYVKSRPPITGAKKALVIGCSTGYGLATRISLAYGCGAATLGVAYENPSNGKRTATAGWYNTAAFEKFVASDGIYAKTMIGDAFSGAMKEKVIDRIKKDLGKVDLVVYSLAAPRRTLDTGEKYSSVIKPVGEAFKNKTIDLNTRRITEITVQPATQEEILGTVKVMGGEDWEWWIDALAKAGVLEDGFVTMAYNYIGPKVTHPIYLDGTIGLAKKDLFETASRLTEKYASMGGKAYISVNKALVTQASAAIPVVPLYISILYKVMKKKGIHEDCIRQMHRLLSEKLYGGSALDEEGRFRVDDLEMRADVQKAVSDIWEKLSNDNIEEYADLEGYWEDFYQLFGFCFDHVDYSADIDPVVGIPSLAE